MIVTVETRVSVDTAGETSREIWLESADERKRVLGAKTDGSEKEGVEVTVDVSKTVEGGELREKGEKILVDIVPRRKGARFRMKKKKRVREATTR